MINIAIIDDDKNFCEEFKSKITNINNSYAVDCFYNITDFLSNAIDYDIAIIDIMLGKDNGIDMAEDITALNPSVKIVFVSIETDYFQEVYSAPHVYFLTKPVSDEQLKKALSLSCSAIDKQYLYIRQKSETVSVDLNNVAYFEGSLKKTIIHFTDGKEKVVSRSLSKIQSMLKNPDFIRIHQSFVVNLNSITGFSSKSVTILSRVIPISRKHITATEDAISRFVGNRLI